jgi:hypothetical protein
MIIVFVRKSLKSVLSKDPNKSTSGYSLKVLAEAFEAPASEGDVPLVASLLSLVANATSSSIKNHTEHTALDITARKGRT